MRLARRIAVIALTFCAVPVKAAGPVPSALADQACAMDAADRSWLVRSLELWGEAESKWLELTPRALPFVIVIDTKCSYRLPDGRFDGLIAWPHEDGMAVVEGDKLPIGPISFANDSGGFVMSLPSVWREAGVQSGLGLEALMEGVLLHEIMHTRQSALANHAFEMTGIALSEDLSDNFVQEALEDDAQYVAAFEQERDLLFAAAAASDLAEVRKLAARALEMMRARHARWFIDDRGYFRDLDGIFLTMEGMGQWMFYRHAVDVTARTGTGIEVAMAETRRGKKQWSQDQGLALILVVDRLLPDWKQRAFRNSDWRAENLLSAAIAASD